MVGAGSQRRDGLRHEQRAARRPGRNRRRDVRRQRRILRQLDHEAERGLRRERRERDRHGVDPLGGGVAVVLATVRHDEQPRPRRDPLGELHQERGGGLVQQVRVVDHEERRVRDAALEQRLDARCDALGDEPLLERCRLGRRGKIEPEHDAEQRQPRLELGCAVGDDGAQRPLGICLGRMGLERQRAAHQGPDRRVRQPSPRLRALHAQGARVLARARTARAAGGSCRAPAAGDDREGTRSVARSPERGEQRLELGVAADERAARLDLALAERLAERDRAHELGLALGGERGDRRGPVRRLRTLEHVLVREHLAVRCVRHHPRRDVDRVPVEGVGATRRGTDDAGEHPSRMDADAHGEHALVIADRADGAEHQLLLLTAGRPRRPREQDRLHAPVADVGLRERHVDALTGLLDRGDALVERGGERVGAARLEQLVGLAELDERHRDVPVLGVGRAAPQLARVRRRQQPGEIEPGRVEERRHRLGHLGRALERTIPSRASPRSSGGNCRAVAMLSAISPERAAASVETQALASAPATISSRWTPPTRKRWNEPLCTPIDIFSRTGPADVERLRMPASACCMPNAAAPARCAWSSPRKSSRTASPPNLSRSACWA